MSTQTSIPIPAEAPAAPAAPGSLPSRIAQVFFSPGQLFESFREQAPWGGTLLAVVASILGIQLAVVFLISDQVFADYMRQAMVDSGQALPPADQMVGFAKMQKMIGLVAGPILTAISAFVSAFVVWLMFSIIGGGKARYGQYLAIVTHVVFIVILGAVVTFPMMLATGNLEINLSPALFLDGMSRTSFVYLAAAKLDVFNVWALLVAGIGIAAVNRNRSWALYAGVTTVVYLLLTAGVTALVTGLFTGGQAS